ncbi:unnamed protein product, partial [Rotaria magnacalcarata]
MDEEPPTFFVPDTPTNSEANFRTLYEQRHFVLNANEEPSSQFTPVDSQVSLESATQLEEKTYASDSPLVYFELQEKRH